MSPHNLEFFYRKNLLNHLSQKSFPRFQLCTITSEYTMSHFRNHFFMDLFQPVTTSLFLVFNLKASSIGLQTDVFPIQTYWVPHCKNDGADLCSFGVTLGAEDKKSFVTAAKSHVTYKHTISKIGLFSARLLVT